MNGYWHDLKDHEKEYTRVGNAAAATITGNLDYNATISYYICTTYWQGLTQNGGGAKYSA